MVTLHALLALGQTFQAAQVWYTSSDCSGSPAVTNPASTVTESTGCFTTAGAAGNSMKLACDGSVVLTTYLSTGCTSTSVATTQAGQPASMMGCKDANAAQCSAFAHAMDCG